MKKMSLKAEELAVESFETSGDDSRRGTVAAYDSETFDTCQLTAPDPVGTCCRRQC